MNVKLSKISHIKKITQGYKTHLMHLKHMKTYLTHCYSSKPLVVCRQPRLLVNLTAPLVLYPEKTPQERRNSLCSTFCTQSVSSCKLTSWLKPTEKPATHKSTPLCSDQPLLVAVWSWLDLFESSRPHADFCPLTYTHTHTHTHTSHPSSLARPDQGHLSPSGVPGSRSLLSVCQTRMRTVAFILFIQLWSAAGLPLCTNIHHKLLFDMAFRERESWNKKKRDGKKRSDG